MRQHGDGRFFPMQEEHAVYSLRTNGQGFGMTSAARASAGCISSKRTDHIADRQRAARGAVSQYQSKDPIELPLRKQGRPPRAPSEAGLRRIVDAMRAALRFRQNIHVSRKEIAQLAGVTPALVTYYFPEKDELIEAVTIPIVTAMVDAVHNSLSGTGDPRDRLLRAIDTLIDTYTTDATVVELFIVYQASKKHALPDLIGAMEVALLEFFDHWLSGQQGCIYDAAYLQKVAIGMCKIVARRDRAESSQDPSSESRRMTRAEAICAMLLESTALSGGSIAGDGPSAV